MTPNITQVVRCPTFRFSILVNRSSAFFLICRLAENACTIVPHRPPPDQAVLIASKVKIASNSQAVSRDENTMVLTSWGVFPVCSNHMSTMLVIISGSYTCILYKRISPYTLSTRLIPFLLFFCVTVSKNTSKDIHKLIMMCIIAKTPLDVGHNSDHKRSSKPGWQMLSST